MSGVDETIKQWIRQAEKSGELKHNPHLGKPFDFADGFLQTPEKIRMAFKVLKNAGYVPPEVEFFNQLADLKEALTSCEDEGDKKRLRTEIANAQQKINLMVEKINRA